MSRIIDDATVLAMQADVTRPIVLVKVNTPSLDILMCSAMQDLDFGGDTYSYGVLGNISTINETDDLKDASITLTFSAVDPTIIAAVSGSDFVNSTVTVRIMFFDEDWQSVGDGLLFFEGGASSQNIALGQTAEISVNCKSKIAALNRARSERYSDQDQQAKYHGDLGMQYATTVSSKDIVWPAAEWFQ
tara:strand:+ start:2515 stop:3081 length:567 start_codon:yes stop_codon:yes gene_type:complete